MFKYWLYKFGQFWVLRLPLATAYRLAMFVSEMQFYFCPRDRRAVKNNLRVMFPEKSQKEIHAMAKEVFRNFGKYLVEFFRMRKMVGKEYIQKNIKIENFHFFEEAIQKKKGAIFLTAHIGNWELGGVAFSQMGHPLVVIALPHRERPVNDLFNSQREDKGITVVPPNLAVRKCLENLKNEGIVALLGDRDFSLNGEIMDFLGKKTAFPRGPAVFCVKTGAPLIPVFFERNTDDSFTMHFEKPVYPDTGREENENIRAIMRYYVPIIERTVRRVPTQWLMFRQFWID